MSETKANFKNELKSATSLILTFSLPILQHYHIHQNAPATRISGELTSLALKDEREVGETRGKEPKNIERRPDTMEKQVKGREHTDAKTNTKLEKSANERGEQGSKIESHNSSQGEDIVARGRLIGKYKHKFFVSKRKPEERVNTSTSRNRLSISGTLVNTQTTKSGTRSRKIKICNRII